MTNEEPKALRSKISTLEIKGQGKYSKYAPRVFIEQGLYMLATILKVMILDCKQNPKTKNYTEIIFNIEIALDK